MTRLPNDDRIRAWRADFDSADDARMLALWRRGFDTFEIAKLMMRDEASVAGRLTRIRGAAGQQKP